MNKKTFKNLAVSSVLFLALSTTTASASMIWNWHFYRKYQDGFKFEKHFKYDMEAEANPNLKEYPPQCAQPELLRLHPVGSDVDELVRTLKGAGARCWRVQSHDNDFKPVEGEFLVNCRYKIGFIGLGGYGVDIKHYSDNKIVWIHSSIVFGEPYPDFLNKEL